MPDLVGAVKAPSGNLSGRLVYAMRVEEIVTLEDYDKRADKEWPHRIPNFKSLTLQERLGDCIYNYSNLSPDGKPELRRSVHNVKNMERDLGGKNVLIAHKEFYYFGSKAQPLPPKLRGICHQWTGHKSNANDKYVKDFVQWIQSDWEPGQIYGWPDFVVQWGAEGGCTSCRIRRDAAEKDEAEHGKSC